MQNFAIKTADGQVKKVDHVTPLFKEMKWLRVKDLITFNIVTTIFKHTTNTYPDQLLPLPTVGAVTLSTTRQRHNLYVPRTHTDMGARATSVIGPKLWNNLPNNIKNSTILPTLKKKLRENLLTSER